MALITVFVIWAGHQELWALEAEDRNQHADEQPTIFAPTPHVIVRIWDPRRRVWVRQDDV